MNTLTSTIVEKLFKQGVLFMQPLYEAISNSLEANADKIDIVLDCDKHLDGYSSKINGFTITDNGDGFTVENRSSFCTFWSKYKENNFGCKGSGRFSWLAVYNKVRVESRVVNNNEIVEFDFNRKFDNNHIEPKISVTPIVENRTCISFSEVSISMYNIDKKKPFDNRANANIDEIVYNIKDYLIIKLFLLKQLGKKYTISLVMDNQKVVITEEDIPIFDTLNFSINKDDEDYNFEIYYKFTSDQKNNVTINWCADSRVVKDKRKDSININANLPNSDSLTVCLVSKYLNNFVNDARDNFEGLDRDENAGTPINEKRINNELKNRVAQIIKNKYPDLQTQNAETVERVKAEYPHLAVFIDSNTDIIKTKERLIADSKKEKSKRLDKAESAFKEVLNKQKIDTKDFIEATNNISVANAINLAEYFYYREDIVKGLEKAVKTSDTNEKVIHNLFMLKGTTDNCVTNRHMLSNIWLLDDKFMSYAYMASDVEINKIINDITNENEKREVFMDNKKPDIAIFYNKENELKDLVVIEFKRPSAPLGQQETSPQEIQRNIGIIKKNISNVKALYGYIITRLSDEFVESLQFSGFTKCFTHDKDGRLLYWYNHNNNVHIFVLDYNAIITDANARNKTFLDIIRETKAI